MRLSFFFGMVAAVVVILSLVSIQAASTSIVVEELSECTLPKGTIELPEQGSPSALKAGGNILNTAAGKIVPSPWEKTGSKPKGIDEYVQRIRKDRTGDLAYSSLNGGTLIAMSGKMSILGRHLLHEFSGRVLVRPEMVWSTEEKDSSGKGTPGAVEKIEPGTCFLLETVGGKFSLIRVLSKAARSVMIQWVHQPDGSARFDVPKGPVQPIAAGSPSRGKDAETVGSAGDDRRIPSVKSLDGLPLSQAVSLHLTNRAVVIKFLLERVADKSCGVREKSEAIRALGHMRAVEAAPVLASMIGFFDSEAPSFSVKIDVSFPCVPALAEIGKPGSVACLDALRVPVSERDAGLLVLVLTRVEGEGVAAFLLKKKLDAAKDQKERDNMKKALEHVKAISAK